MGHTGLVEGRQQASAGHRGTTFPVWAEAGSCRGARPDRLLRVSRTGLKPTVGCFQSPENLSCEGLCRSAAFGRTERITGQEATSPRTGSLSGAPSPPGHTVSTWALHTRLCPRKQCGTLPPPAWKGAPAHRPGADPLPPEVTGRGTQGGHLDWRGQGKSGQAAWRRRLVQRDRGQGGMVGERQRVELLGG